MKYALEIDQSNKFVYTIFDYLFWVALIFFTNTGGILQTLHIWYVVGKVTMMDVLFILLSICYIIVPKNHNIFDQEFIKVKKLLIFFLAYYLIVFAYIVPLYNENINYSILITLFKSRWQVYNIFIFMYIYELFKRRSDIFLRIFLFSSILIIVLFLQEIVTKIEILPIELVNREFYKINRYIIVNYALMPLLVPLGAVVFVFKLRIKYRNMILIGFFLMSIAWIVSITRRHIVGIIIYFILALMTDAYLRKRYIILLNNTIKILLLLILLSLISYLVFPRYLDAAGVGIQESFSILKSGKTLEGDKDVRMTLDRPFINQQFYNHPLFGTGFDNRWRTGEGDKQGYEASDYPFLSALAMFGVVGVLVFLPVYIIIIKSLKKDYKFLRANPEIDHDIIFLLFIALTLYFVFHLLQYFNYFVAIAFLDDYSWYFFLSLYLAARSEFYNSQLINSKLESSFILENDSN